jgi:hypothetical protein
MFDPFAVGAERARAIELVDGEIELAVRLAQLGRHGVRVVQIGKAGGGVLWQDASPYQRLDQLLTQKSTNAVLEQRFILCFTFPDHEDLPARSLERGDCIRIPLSVPLNLRTPVIRI